MTDATEAGRTARKHYRYSPIEERRPGRWPNGAGLAVYIALNIEEYAYGTGLTEDLVPGMPQPDVLNAAWRDYGARVGAFRLLDLFRDHGLAATLLLNSLVTTECPALAARIARESHEVAGHGRTNSESQNGLSDAAEQALFSEVAETIAARTGRRPTGWLSPWLAETPNTPSNLRQAGFRYVLDFCADDQPIWLPAGEGRILAIPYSQEINDSVAIIGRNVSASDFADMIIDQTEEMLVQARTAPLVFGIALHANIMGQPFRLRHLRRALAHLEARSAELWLTDAGSIADAAAERPEMFV